VLAAAAADAEHGADTGDDVTDGNRDDTTGDLETIPFVSTEPVARSRRRPMASMIAAVGVAALVLTGAFAVSAMVGGGGGSNSAEGAVRRLADALSHEDVLTAADVMAPSEVRSLHGTLDAAAKKAQELQLVSNSGAPLAGVDFNVNDLKLSSQTLADGYVKVTVDAGTFTASTQKAKFSALMQKALRNADDNSAQSDLATLFADHHVPTFLVVVRQGGNWYVSAAYTVLEYEREIGRLPAADFGSGQRNIATLGADSPDAAVQDAMRALQRNDWSKLMGMVSPTEIPFYDYRDAMNALIHKTDGGPSTNFTIDAMTTNAQVDGDTAKVALTVSGTTDSGKWSLRGGCFTPPGEQSGIYPCGGAPVFFGLLGLPATGPDAGSQFDVVKQDGRWFVSPVGTVLDVVDHLITQLDQRSLFTFLGIPNQLPPDGPLVLGQPVVLTKTDTMKVLTLTGHKGESIVGGATPKAKSSSASFTDSMPPAFVQVFAPDGSLVGSDCCLLDGQPLILPADGTYVVVMQGINLVAHDATVTIWDTTSAPAGTVTELPDTNGSGSCTLTPFGGESCQWSSGVLRPGSVPAGSSGQCTTSGNQTTCVAPTPEPGGESIKSSGQNGGGSFGVGGPASTLAVPTVPTPTPSNGSPTSVNGSGSGGDNSVSSSGTSSVPHG